MYNFQSPMNPNNYRKVLIWSGWFRLSHWFLAISTLVLMLTGWLMTNSLSLHGSALAYHLFAAGIFTAGLLLRIILFITGKNQQTLPAMIPNRLDIKTVKAMLLFYITLGKSPLPNWYAQNPFWKPVYLVLYLVFILVTLSGLLISSHTEIAGFILLSVHQLWAQVIFYFSLLHIGSVILCDYKAQRYDISAMLHGYKLFNIQSETMKPREVIQKVDLNTIK